MKIIVRLNITTDAAWKDYKNTWKITLSHSNYHKYQNNIFLEITVHGKIISWQSTRKLSRLYLLTSRYIKFRIIIHFIAQSRRNNYRYWEFIRHHIESEENRSADHSTRFPYNLHLIKRKYPVFIRNNLKI